MYKWIHKQTYEGPIQNMKPSDDSNDDDGDDDDDDDDKWFSALTWRILSSGM